MRCSETRQKSEQGLMVSQMQETTRLQRIFNMKSQHSVTARIQSGTDNRLQEAGSHSRSREELSSSREHVRELTERILRLERLVAELLLENERLRRGSE